MPAARASKAGREETAEYRELFRRARQERIKFEADWYLNLAYYLGDQWVFWNRDRLDRPRLNNTRVMLVENRIQGINLTRMARKVKQRPVFVATPATADQSDLDSAELAEKVLEADWKMLGMTRKHLAAEAWAEICCAGFWKVYWDRDAGESNAFVVGPDGAPVQHPETGRPVRAEQLQQVLPQLPEGYGQRTVAEGRPCVEVLSPFEFYPDPLATTMDDLEWCVEVKVRSKEYIEKRWPKKMDELKPDAQVPGGGITESRFGVGAYSGTTQVGPPDNRGYKVYELSRAPCPKYPNGQRVTWCNDVKLEEVTSEELYDPIPYVMFEGVEVPGRFWPTSITSQLRGPQTELNKIKSQIRETANRIGNPALLWSRFNGECEYEGAPGGVVTFDDGGGPNAKPSFLVPPEMPVYVQNEVDRIETSIREISGLHEVSNATVPSGVTAASAINLLQEADETRLGPEVTLMEETLSSAGDKLLRLRARFTDAATMIRLGGEDGDWDIQEFRGQMLDKSVVNVEVQGGSMMPRSKAAKQAAMTEVFGLLLQYAGSSGVALDQRAIRGFFRDYEAGAIDKLFAGVAPDENQIIRENRLMGQGTALDITAVDNDQLHIDGHEEHMKGSRYQRYDPEVQKIFSLHLAAHRERSVIAVQQQVADQAKGAADASQAAAEQEQQNKMAQGQQQIEGKLAQTALTAAAQQQAAERQASGGGGSSS